MTPGAGRGSARLDLLVAPAALLALVAYSPGILLTGISVWFFSARLLAGAGGAAYTFNFHIPAALIRLLAMAHGGKYGERLVGPKAALLDQVFRRAALFSAVAAVPKVPQRRCSPARTG